MPTFEKRHGNPFTKMQGLVSELHKIDFTSYNITLSDELSQLYEESRSIISSWRRRYGYSLTDPRFLDARPSVIFKDYLLEKLYELSEHFDETKEMPIITEQELIEDVQKELKAMKENKNNYATPEDYDAYWQEKEELREKYQTYRQLMGDEAIKEMVRKKYAEQHITQHNKEVAALLKDKESSRKK